MINCKYKFTDKQNPKIKARNKSALRGIIRDLQEILESELALECLTVSITVEQTYNDDEE